MTWDVVYFCMSAFGYLPERYVLGEVHRFVDFYFFHLIFHFDFPFESLKV
jgi:hypothetical protein